jgi:hypothetical protein
MLVMRALEDAGRIRSALWRLDITIMGKACATLENLYWTITGKPYLHFDHRYVFGDLQPRIGPRSSLAMRRFETQVKQFLVYVRELRSIESLPSPSQMPLEFEWKDLLNIYFDMSSRLRSKASELEEIVGPVVQQRYFGPSRNILLMETAQGFGPIIDLMDDLRVHWQKVDGFLRGWEAFRVEENPGTHSLVLHTSEDFTVAQSVAWLNYVYALLVIASRNDEAVLLQARLERMETGSNGLSFKDIPKEIWDAVVGAVVRAVNRDAYRAKVVGAQIGNIREMNQALAELQVLAARSRISEKERLAIRDKLLALNDVPLDKVERIEVDGRSVPAELPEPKAGLDFLNIDL